MSIPADSFIDNENHTDVTSNELVYDICGYILHSRSQVLECEKCKVLLKRNESQLPENYPPANYTLSRTYSDLELASERMFLTFRQVERIVDDHFASSEHVFIRDAFENVVNQIGTLNLFNLSCDEHPGILPYLIMEYIMETCIFPV